MGERRLGQMHGHILDSAHVERYVLARGAVAARGGAHKGAVLVGKRHAQTVDLKLAGISDATGTKRILSALEHASSSSKSMASSIEYMRAMCVTGVNCSLT